MNRDLLAASTLPLLLLAIFSVQVARRGGRVALIETLGLCAVFTGVMIAVYGIGFTWSAWSVIGKILALAVATGLPVACGAAGDHP